MDKKILIVDDETEYLIALKKVLHEFGYSVCITVSSTQALDIIKKEKPDLVLFDYKIPEMDGDAFLRKAKELSPAIPYLLITAWNDVSALSRFKKLGVIDIILKPINLEDLLKKIQAILRMDK